MRIFPFNFKKNMISIKQCSLFTYTNNFKINPTNVHMLHGNYSFSMPKPYTSMTMPKKFPQDIECVIRSNNPACGSLFISNIEAAQNLATLKKHQIGAVLSCAKGYQLNHPLSAVPHYKYIPTVDHDGCDISKHFEEAADFLKETLAKTNVLAHCIAGVSRSVSMVIAYLIRQRNLSYEEGYRLVKQKRKIICPNDGFIRQLKQYEKTKKEKIQQKSRDLPLTQSREIRNNASKSYSYTDLNNLPMYKSTEMTPKTENKQDLSASKYQSIQLSPRRGDMSYSYTKIEPVKRQPNYYQKYGIYRTSTGFFTPKKGDNIPQNREDIIKDYGHSQHLGRHAANIDRYQPASEKMIRIEPPIGQRVEIRPATTVKLAKRDDEIGKEPMKSQLKNSFAEMNRELNQKIDLIRKKYDDERKKLYEKYQTPLRNYSAQKNEDHSTADKQINQQTVDRQPIEPRKRVSVTIQNNWKNKQDYQPIQRNSYNRVSFENKQISTGYMSHGNRYDDPYSRKLDLTRGWGQDRKDTYLGRYDNGYVRNSYSNYIGGYNMDYRYKRY